MRKIFLTVASFLIISCAHKVESVYETDTDNMLCVEYEITDYDKLLFREKARHHISKCNGVFGVAHDDVGYVLDKAREAMKKLKDRIKKALK